MQVSTAAIGALIFTPTGDLIKTIKLQGVIFTMATIDKINKDIAAAKVKIAELQKKIRTLEAQKIEEENLQIVKLVKTVNLDQKTLTVFLKAYAKGDIVLPDTYKAELEKNDKKEKPETTGEQKPHEQKHAQEGGNNEKK